MSRGHSVPARVSRRAFFGLFDCLASWGRFQCSWGCSAGRITYNGKYIYLPIAWWFNLTTGMRIFTNGVAILGNIGRLLYSRRHRSLIPVSLLLQPHQFPQCSSRNREFAPHFEWVSHCCWWIAPLACNATFRSYERAYTKRATRTDEIHLSEHLLDFYRMSRWCLWLVGKQSLLRQRSSNEEWRGRPLIFRAWSNFWLSLCCTVSGQPSSSDSTELPPAILRRHKFAILPVCMHRKHDICGLHSSLCSPERGWTEPGVQAVHCRERQLALGQCRDALPGSHYLCSVLLVQGHRGGIRIVVLWGWELGVSPKGVWILGAWVYMRFTATALAQIVFVSCLFFFWFFFPRVLYIVKKGVSLLYVRMGGIEWKWLFFVPSRVYFRLFRVQSGSVGCMI